MQDSFVGKPLVADSSIDTFSLAWAEFENVIGKNYLDVLNQAIAVDADFDFDEAFAQIKANQIVRIVYDKNENTLAKLSNLYSALNMSKSSVFVLLQNQGNNTNFYIGVRSDNEQLSVEAQEVLQNSFYGNFPGVEQQPVCSGDEDIKNSFERISDFIRQESSAFATVTGVPSLKEDTAKEFSQGLEKLIDAMGDRLFSALFIATPFERPQLLELENQYQKLYSELSLLNISQLSLSEQESVSLGKSISEGFSKSLSESTSLATTQTCGTSTSTTDGKTTSLASAAAGAGAAAGAALGTWVFPGVGTVAGAAIGGGVAAIAGAFLGSKSHTETTGTTESTSQSTTETHGTTTTTTTNTTTTETLTDTKGQAYQYEVKNRRVADALKILDEQLERIRIAKSYGAWNWAAYFTGDKDTVKIGAETYSGILRGEKTGVEHCAISYWTNDMRDFDKALKDISCIRHPRFNIGRGSRKIIVSPTAMLSTQEMAVGMAIPQKSIPGLPVFESVEFGRSVTTYDHISGEKCCIGNVSHFGTESKCNPVMLDLKSLTSHTFVTGSTGSGKSNMIYTLLRELSCRENPIPFLVIEPAKGEYKDVFGGCEGVNVFGSNPYLTPLLKINPFAFPYNDRGKGIHIMEHIDRLIEILNAVWPMYAAMPAILKEAVELTYKRCGWDLLNSKNKYTPAVFPDFHDLLQELPSVIEATKYADEIKSNYAGALLTRVKSLTNGYYRNIFQKEELDPAVLFDQSCIIDISRVGSSETKSLIMGIVFLKLQEYRMSSSQQKNSTLRHITILEEAHNLLRKTSSNQSMEGANLQGKSVEMITNAIAEMRTYGEGFIIVDQSPGLLDESVIRNTNTKIVLRLPDFDDRLLVGKAQNLQDEQINELARLKTGCASVYQNNWQEAVLCQIPYNSDAAQEKPLEFIAPENVPSDTRTVAEEEMLKLLSDRIAGINDVLSEDKRRLLQKYYPEMIVDEEAGSLNKDKALTYYNVFIALPQQIKEIKGISDFKSWTNKLINQVFAIDTVAKLDTSRKDILLGAMFELLKLQDSKQKELWEREAGNILNWRKW